MVKQSLPLFFQVAVRFTQMADKIQPIWKLGKQRGEKYIGLALAGQQPPGQNSSFLSQSHPGTVKEAGMTLPGMPTGTKVQTWKS